MASVHQRPAAKYWHPAFRMADGRLILRSTKCTDRQQALAATMEFERAAKLAGAGNLMEAQARKIIAAIMERSGTDETLRSPAVKDYLTAWLTRHAAHVSPGTSTVYRQTVDDFLTSLGDRQGKPLTALSPSDVEKYQTSRMGEKLAPKTVILSVKIIRSALNHARRQGLITSNPAEAVELPKTGGTERGTFTPAEVKMLVDAAEGDWKTLILLAHFAGARMGDCCRTAWADVDLGGGSTIPQQGDGDKSG